jgi:hypothetical protein
VPKTKPLGKLDAVLAPLHTSAARNSLLCHSDPETHFQSWNRNGSKLATATTRVELAWHRRHDGEGPCPRQFCYLSQWYLDNIFFFERPRDCLSCSVQRLQAAGSHCSGRRREVNINRICFRTMRYTLTFLTNSYS